jgi:SAM-dependent methyltransferase
MTAPESNRTEADNEIPVVEISCPLCDASEYAGITQVRDYVYDVPGLFTFVRCTSCQHIYLNPRPCDDAIMRCYPTDYEPHLTQASNDGLPSGNQANAGPSLIRRVLRTIPYLRSFLIWLGQQHATVIPNPPSDQARLSEVGCAHGGYLQQAAAAGWTVDGIEPDEAAAKRARARGFPVQTSTLPGAKMDSASREAIVAWMVLEHVPDPMPFVQEAFRVLSRNGTFAVSVPNGGGFERRMFGKYWLGYDAPRHLQVFTTKILRKLLDDAGFVEVKIIHQSSIRYWWGSIAAWGLDNCPNATWPARWMDYFINDPPGWMKWLSFVPEKMLAVLHLSGRITVVAKKR